MSRSLNRSLLTRIAAYQSAPWLLLVAVILAATWVLTARQDVGAFPNDDTVVYSVIAKFWAQGDLPYRDLVDHKPPGIYLFYRLCFWIWGESPTALWQGFTALTGLCAGLLVWAFASINLGAAGLGIGASFALFFLTDPLRLTVGAFLNTELLASACLALALAFTVMSQRGRRLLNLFLAGLAFGFALISKQPSAVFAPALLTHIAITCWRRPLGAYLRNLILGLSAFTFGTILPAGALVAWYAYEGALQDLIYWVHTANLSYTGIGGATISNRLAVLGEHQAVLWKYLGQPAAYPFLLCLYLTPILFLLRRSWFDVVAALWVVGGLATASLNTQQSHTHYLVFYQVPAALVVGALFLTISNLCSWRRWGEWRATPLALIAFVLLFRQDLSTIKERIQVMLNRPPQTAPLQFQAEMIKSMSDATAGLEKTDTIFFLGMTPVALFYSDIKPASQYIYRPPHATISDDKFYGDLIDDIVTKKPAVAFIQTYRDSTFLPERPDRYGEFSRVFLDNFEPWMWAPHGRVFKRKEKAPHP